MESRRGYILYFRRTQERKEVKCYWTCAIKPVVRHTAPPRGTTINYNLLEMQTVLYFAHRWHYYTLLDAGVFVNILVLILSSISIVIIIFLLIKTKLFQILCTRELVIFYIFLLYIYIYINFCQFCFYLIFSFHY